MADIIDLTSDGDETQQETVSMSAESRETSQSAVSLDHDAATDNSQPTGSGDSAGDSQKRKLLRRDRLHLDCCRVEELE